MRAVGEEPAAVAGDRHPLAVDDREGGLGLLADRRGSRAAPGRGGPIQPTSSSPGSRKRVRSAEITAAASARA